MYRFFALQMEDGMRWQFLSGLVVLGLVSACPKDPDPRQEGDACDEILLCAPALVCTDGICRQAPQDGGAGDAATSPDGSPDLALVDVNSGDRHVSSDLCDQRLTLVPDPPMAGQPVAVAFSDGTAYGNVNLHVTAQGSPSVAFIEYTNPPPTFHYQVTGFGPGRMDFVATGDGIEVYRCFLEAVGEGQDAGGAVDSAGGDAAGGSADATGADN